MPARRPRFRRLLRQKTKNFCGFASLLTYGGITHILYFAIDEQYREHGYGSEALKLMHTLYPKNRFIADLELDIPTAENEPQRHLRRAFYLRNGYTPVRGALHLAGRAVRNFSQQRHHHKTQNLKNFLGSLSQ